MPRYYGYCPTCKQSGPVWLETLVNRPPLNCKTCGGLIEVSASPPTPNHVNAPCAAPANTPEATVTQVGPPADDVNTNGSLVWLSQGRREFFVRLMARAFTDERGLVGYTEV